MAGCGCRLMSKDQEGQYPNYSTLSERIHSIGGLVDVADLVPRLNYELNRLDPSIGDE